MPDANLPTRIDRAAVDRVLARALELQASASGEPQAEQLTEAQLLELAKEVGLDPVNLRQALAEERTRVAVPDEAGMMASIFGGAYASAQRTVRGAQPDVLRALDDWMQRQECLAVQRYFSSERIVWEPRRGIVDVVRRIGGKGEALARVNDVSATVIPVDASRVLVRLDARLLGFRSMMASQSAALTTAGLVTGGVLAVLAFPVFAIAAPVAVLAPAGVAAGRAAHRRTVQRAQLALEQVLDRLERGEAGRPPTLLSMLAAVARGK